MYIKCGNSKMTIQEKNGHHPATTGHKQPPGMALVSGTKCTGKPKQQIKEGGAVSKKRLLNVAFVLAALG